MTKTNTLTKAIAVILSITLLIGIVITMPRLMADSETSNTITVNKTSSDTSVGALEGAKFDLMGNTIDIAFGGGYTAGTADDGYFGRTFYINTIYSGLGNEAYAPENCDLSLTLTYNGQPATADMYQDIEFLIEYADGTNGEWTTTGPWADNLQMSIDANGVLNVTTKYSYVARVTASYTMFDKTVTDVCYIVAPGDVRRDNSLDGCDWVDIKSYLEGDMDTVQQLEFSMPYAMLLANADIGAFHAVGNEEEGIVPVDSTPTQNPYDQIIDLYDWVGILCFVNDFFNYYDMNGNLVSSETNQIFYGGAELSASTTVGTEAIPANTVKVASGITDVNGQIVFDDLPYNGSYLLVETESPNAHYLAEDTPVDTTNGNAVENIVDMYRGPVITLTYGSDENGSVIEWMLKGDANRDGMVTDEDYILTSNYINDAIDPPEDPLVIESYNLLPFSMIEPNDWAVVYWLLHTDVITLPDSQFTYRVVDKPNAGYRVASAVITASGGVEVTLTPASPVSGDYVLEIDENGVATITGQSLAVNDVHIIHEPIETEPEEAAIILIYGSDANGSISEWMLKGDANRDMKVDDDDLDTVSAHVSDSSPITDMYALESANVNSDEIINVSDVAKVGRVLSGSLALPNNEFTYRVVDTPNEGYALYNAIITTPNGPIELNKFSPTSGNYNLAIDANGVATVTGQSLATNDVQFTHISTEPVITLNYGCDANGSVTEWMLKGDATRDGIVDEEDYYRILAIANGSYSPNELEEESSDLAVYGPVNSVDFTLVLQLINQHHDLPSSVFTFRVKDTPATGYKVATAKITTPGGVEVTLTPEAPNSGNYALAIDANGVATVTGQSLATNDVRFTHEPVETEPEEAAIILTYGSDENGEVTEWMLKGDANRSGSINPTDALIVNQAMTENPALADDPLVFDSGDVNQNGELDEEDVLLINQLIVRRITLPDSRFTFRVVDTPNSGWKVATAKITTPDGEVPLTPDAPVSGNYALAFDANGVATVTGQSLATNDVRFTHEPDETDPPVIQSGTIAIPLTKIISGGTPMTPETFTFNIAAHSGATGDSAQITNPPLPVSTACTVSGAGNTAFDAITYTSAGRYYYDITEVTGSNPEYEYDNSKYTICVEVTNNATGGLSASIVAMWKEGATEKPTALLFNNTFTPTIPGSLTLSKTVTGEFGNHNKEFSFLVTFSDESYSFDAGIHGAISNGTGTITLKHNESITFTGISAGVTYTIVEDLDAGSEYSTTISNNGTPVTGVEATGTVARNTSVTVAYTNDLPYDPIVGLNMDMLPFIVLGVLALGVFAFLITKKSKRSNI